MKNAYGFAMALTAALGLSACGSSEQDVKNVTNDKVHELNFMDTFKTQCENIPLDLFNLHARKVEYVIAGHIEKKTTYFGSDDCQGEVLVIKETGKYENVDVVQAGSDIGRVDITFEKVLVTPKNEDVKNEMNTVGYCGIKDWGTDEKEVTHVAGDAKCVGTENVGKTAYDIFSTRNGELRFGLAVPIVADKSAPEKRPTQLSPDVVARK